jgi:GT2 family glycosyltransferase
VLVAIVNYRTPVLTVECLRSLAAERGRVPWLRAVVADAASGDDSVAAIGAAIAREGFAGWASLAPLPRNGGFAYGNNAVLAPALRAAEPPDYLMLLNPDTVVRPGAVAALVAFLEAHPAVGIAGSRLEGPGGELQHSAFRVPGVLSELEFGLRLGWVSRLLARWSVSAPPRVEAHETGWVSGAALMVRREVFERVGLLDEGYFLYFEELDFCLRAARAGWPSWHVPESRVVHLAGQSTGLSGAHGTPDRWPSHWFESRRRFFLKSFSPAKALAADLAFAAGFALWRIRRRLQRRPDTDPPHFLADFVRHSALRTGFRP